jgi:hypothetical protein
LHEIYRTTIHTGRQEELRFILSRANLVVESCRSPENPGGPAPLHRLRLPLPLWPRFHEAVCCLGAFMKPLPAPAYQTRSCCSYTCALPPEPLVLELDHRIQLHLSLQDRRGSTFLEITSVHSLAAGNAAAVHTIRIGPTLWSAFLATMENLAQIIADL